MVVTTSRRATPTGRAIFARGRSGRGSPPPTSNTQAPIVGEADGERGFIFARRLAGERTLPSSGGYVLISEERLCHHLLVCGATGSGKTETLLRLAWSIAKASDAQVFYLDGKGDRGTAERFCGLMADAGRETRVFPNQPFDGWRGGGHEIQGRLMQIIDYAADGPASWYRDIAKTALGLVCDHPEGPPRSSRQVLGRLDFNALKAAHPTSTAIDALSAEQIRQVRLRYEAFFAQTRGALDGDWSWQDTSSAYLIFDSLALREETTGLSRFIFEDFAHYFATVKPKGRLCVMIVDEFSSLTGAGGMAARVEQARGFHTSLILAPQVLAGMGDEAEIARIKGSVQTVICHRVNTPDDVIALAGTKLSMEYSSQYQREGMSGAGSARLQHQFKIDPNQVRGLPPGVVYVISHGKAMKAKVLRAPELRVGLPQTDQVRTPLTPEHTSSDQDSQPPNPGASLPF